ncbi:MAG: DUF2635 domain-containing protein [Candidatus Accumulibacter sp.]|jgi:hypothetical protein|nr:DUF2635 domain-containing protein [Accumulibacter sp.]
MRIKPVEGRVIRDPDTGIEVKGERLVPDEHPFWLRCLASGDLEKIDTPAPFEKKD